jgi:uncharacterized FlaG/YvyC family protein
MVMIMRNNNDVDFEFSQVSKEVIITVSDEYTGETTCTVYLDEYAAIELARAILEFYNL